MNDFYSFHNKTKQKIDDRLFFSIKNKILPKEYSLSVVCIGEKKGRDLNKKYREKKYNPNVLSFPIDTKTGEIFLNPLKIKKEASLYGHTQKEHLHFLFIHGCFHLAGYAHGSTMEEAECRMMRLFFPLSWKK
jgi:probable rRNA maturation factor